VQAGLTALQALILGVVQGLTEFLPISSDGHLALTYKLFGQSPDLAFEVFLHLATLIAMIVYFRSDIADLLRSLGPEGKGSDERRLVVLIVVATAVTGALGLALKKVVEIANESLLLIGVGFLVTSAAMVVAELLARRVESREPKDLGYGRTAAIAVAQASAVLPGVSRSGLTISAGMLSGLTRESAARFSFILGIPVIALANVLLDAKDLITGAASVQSIGVAAVGFVAAGLTGYAAIWGLLRFVKSRPLYVFSVYTCLVGATTIAWALLS
jgi:undecaprenyl-diphosphatase